MYTYTRSGKESRRPSVFSFYCLTNKWFLVWRLRRAPDKSVTINSPSRATVVYLARRGQRFVESRSEAHAAIINYTVIGKQCFVAPRAGGITFAMTSQLPRSRPISCNADGPRVVVQRDRKSNNEAVDFIFNEQRLINGKKPDSGAPDYRSSLSPLFIRH